MLDFFSKVKQIRASGNDQGEILLNSQPPFFLKVLNAHDNNITKSLISKLEKKIFPLMNTILATSIYPHSITSLLISSSSSYFLT